MIFEPVNYLSLIVASLVPMIVGSLWYGPLFGEMWIKLMGFTKSQMSGGKNEMYKAYGFSLVGSVVIAFVLTQIFAMANVLTVQEALSTAFMLWLAFIAATKLNDVVWGGKPWSLYMLDVGYQLTSILLISLVLIFLG